MPVRLNRSNADFDELFARFLAAKREVSADVEAAARAIVQDVADRGDAALIEATRKFDRLDLDASRLRVTAAEIDVAFKACDSITLDALKFARDRIETFHRRQLPKDEQFTDSLGVELGWRWSAVDAVGLYVPGGNAVYPSSVVMNVVPAQVAGVRRILVTTPPRTLAENPAVAAALVELNVTEVYAVGGAQAIAALAYGTETVPRVDKITGPGNKYVAAAKKLKGPKPKIPGDRAKFTENIRQALYASKIVSYAQGYMLMRAAAKEYNWNLNYGGIALMWRGGCIIRSRFLGEIKKAFDKNPKLTNLMLDKFFAKAIKQCQRGWRNAVATAAKKGIPVPAFSTALAFYDGFRSERLPANLLQAQRDYFGAHTYERVDKPRGEFFHTNWTGRGGTTASGTYTV